jgi:2'-5' RNA ligase
MKIMQKYFLALVPEGEIAEKALQIKENIREQFNVKYALKSPSHITLKMPFSYNEAKENYLRANLEDFAKDWPGFRLRFPVWEPLEIE